MILHISTREAKIARKPHVATKEIFTLKGTLEHRFQIFKKPSVKFHDLLL